MSKEPTLKTAKRLYAVSGNLCAFPRCPTSVVDLASGVLIAEICHIKARSEGGPRYDRTQTDTQRNAFENLILLCAVHHKIIDSDVASYPVERLQEMKAGHEEKYKNGALPSDELARKLLLTLTVSGSIVTSNNQSGGQTAHQINNYYQQPAKPTVILTPIIEHPLTRVDRECDMLGYYDFRISLRNDGPKTVKEFRVDVEIPRKYGSPSSYSAEVNSRNPENRLFRHTELAMSPVAPFNLFPGDTIRVFLLSFLITREQFLAGITESIRVSVFSDDELLSGEDHPIANMLNHEHVELMLKT
jgi:hypothetical protein